MADQPKPLFTTLPEAWDAMLTAAPPPPGMSAAQLSNHRAAFAIGALAVVHILLFDGHANGAPALARALDEIEADANLLAANTQ